MSEQDFDFETVIRKAKEQFQLQMISQDQYRRILQICQQKIRDFDKSEG